MIEEDKRLSGRGAYLHSQKECWEVGIRTSLGNALRTDLSAEDIERLQSVMDTLPKSEGQESTKEFTA